MKFSDSSLSTHLQIIRHTGSLHDISAGGLLDPEGIICPIVCASTVTLEENLSFGNDYHF
jgi:hypothetical protein